MSDLFAFKRGDKFIHDKTWGFNILGTSFKCC